MAVRLLKLCVPEVLFDPDHAPLAVHDVALLLDHVSVVDPPFVIDAGVAVSMTAGTGVTIDTLTDWVVLPPFPVHVSE